MDSPRSSSRSLYLLEKGLLPRPSMGIEGFLDELLIDPLESYS